MNEEEFYNKVGEINGWNFSDLQVELEGVEWDFNEKVREIGKESDTLLDLGTGGGENVIRLAADFLFLIGIDSSQNMIRTAKRNLEKYEISNISFHEMSNHELAFPDQFFHIVTCRHAPFTASEVNRVLKQGGTFITQQVSEEDKLNLKKEFGRGQSYGEQGGKLKQKYKVELKEAGFTSIVELEYNATEYYKRKEDLLFLLNHTPIIPNFLEGSIDIDRFDQFIQTNKTKKGIRTNSKRFLLIATK
ncbi:class I SAM-dependent methyltransferase [Alkalihalobacillus sp. FSL W8-0930]